MFALFVSVNQSIAVNDLLWKVALTSICYKWALTLYLVLGNCCKFYCEPVSIFSLLVDCALCLYTLRHAVSLTNYCMQLLLYCLVFGFNFLSSFFIGVYILSHYLDCKIVEEISWLILYQPRTCYCGCLVGIQQMLSDEWHAEVWQSANFMQINYSCWNLAKRYRSM